MDARSPLPRQSPPPVEWGRLAQARMLVPLARTVRDSAKEQADSIGRTERRFGSAEIRHLARLLDDLWMAADSFVCDMEANEADENR